MLDENNNNPVQIPVGSSLEKVVKVIIFVTDMEQFNHVVDLRTKHFSAPYPADGCITYEKDDFYFYEGEQANFEISPDVAEKLEHAVNRVKSYQDYFKSLGVEFIFLPIPNKENIYYELLPSKEKPALLMRFIERLEEERIDVIDTQTLFDEHKKEGLLYHKDDTHWNSVAVSLVGREIKNSLSDR